MDIISLTYIHDIMQEQENYIMLYIQINKINDKWTLI